MRKFLSDNIILIVILSIAAFLLCYKIDKPFWGHHDWNGAYWGTVARNYVRYGLWQTKLASVDSVGLTSPSEFRYTFHYPPLFPLIMSAFYSSFGVHEWSVRLMSLLFSLWLVALIYRLALLRFSRRVAIIATIFAIFNPMFIYFGKMPVHEIIVLPLSLSALYFFAKNSMWKVTVFIFLAELTTWPGYFIVPAITVYSIVLNKDKVSSLKKTLPFWLLSFITFLLLLIHNRFITGAFFGGGLAEIFLFRIKSVSFIPYISELLRWSITYYLFLLPLSALWILLSVLKKIRHWEIPLALFVFAIIYPIIFRDASFRHDYLLIYFLPFLSLSSSIVLNYIFKKKQLINIVVPILIMATLLIRGKFILALENSDIYRESVRFGKFINENSNTNDNVEVAIEDPNVGFDGWHTAYYADRVEKRAIDASTAASQRHKVKIYYLRGGKIIRK